MTGKSETASLPERFASRIRVADSGCWEWIGAKSGSGYGAVWLVSQVKRTTAHRAVYEELVGPVPAGLELDHLCRNRPCVNPGHLEPVTHRVNLNRGPVNIERMSKTHCPQGHPYAGGNLYVWRGARACRTCRAEAKARFDARREGVSA